MGNYIPDNWVVLKITVKPEETLYKVLAGWSGGYLDSDYWRMNSGVTEVKEDGDYYEFYGESGSRYRCHKNSYRLTMAIAGVYNALKENEAFEGQITLMPEDTNWMEVEF